MFDRLIPWKKRSESSDGLSLQKNEDSFTALRRDFDSLLSRFWDEGSFGSFDSGGLFRSSVDLDENENEYVMTAEMPGFEPSEIDVKVSGNTLTIRAEHNEESNGKHGRTRRYGSRHESFTLPTGVKSEAVEASYRNGVLKIHVPKDESVQSKRIEVKVA
jgi:HSP20 family protein